MWYYVNHDEAAEESFDLERFLAAQERDYALALAEIRSGKKNSHWIWYIFPQLTELGFSETARYYGIPGLEEAKAYYAHPVLRARLLEISGALLELDSSDAFEVMGYPDILKLSSCMTLFAIVSAPHNDLFLQVLDKFYGGRPDINTLRIIFKPDYFSDDPESHIDIHPCVRTVMQPDGSRIVVQKQPIEDWDGTLGELIVGQIRYAWTGEQITEVSKSYTKIGHRARIEVDGDGKRFYEDQPIIIGDSEVFMTVKKITHNAEGSLESMCVLDFDEQGQQIGYKELSFCDDIIVNRLFWHTDETGTRTLTVHNSDGYWSKRVAQPFTFPNGVSDYLILSWEEHKLTGETESKAYIFDAEGKEIGYTQSVVIPDGRRTESTVKSIHLPSSEHPGLDITQSVVLCIVEYDADGYKRSMTTYEHTEDYQKVIGHVRTEYDKNGTEIVF